MFFRQSSDRIAKPSFAFIAYDRLRWSRHTCREQGDKILAAFSGRDVTRLFASGGTLARREVTVSIHHALFGEVAEPAERIAVSEIGVGKFAKRLDGDF